MPRESVSDDYIGSVIKTKAWADFIPPPSIPPARGGKAYENVYRGREYPNPGRVGPDFEIERGEQGDKIDLASVKVL